MKPALPTAALTPARVPGPDASNADVLRFATALDGYEAVGGDASALGRYVAPFDGAAYNDLALDDLRVLLFARQRAHYHQGGGYPGEPDTLMDEMRAITAAIRRRVEARGQGTGVWRGDITTLDVDAVVNAANRTLAGGGGVDGAIHRAAGPALLEACLALPELRPGVRCPTGGARITDGYGLPARHVIHAVGPVWHGGEQNERALLAAAYRNSLALAAERALDTVAFPAISTGAYGYPAFDAATVAVETVAAFLDAHAHPQRVVLVAFDAEAEKAWRRALRRQGEEGQGSGT